MIILGYRYSKRGHLPGGQGGNNNGPPLSLLVDAVSLGKLQSGLSLP
jgi:hypothetical protein